MADEPKPAEVTETSKSFSQEDIDRIVTQRLTREREKFADYEDWKKKAETLEAQEKKRQEAEMSELDKLKLQLDEKESAIGELSKHKEWRDNWNKQQEEKISEAIKDFSDEDKDLVNSVPLEKRMAMVNKLSEPKEKPSPLTGKMFEFSTEKIPTDKEYMDLRDKLGWQHPDVIRAGMLIRKREQGA